MFLGFSELSPLVRHRSTGHWSMEVDMKYWANALSEISGCFNVWV